MVAWHLNEATPMAGLVPSYAIGPDWPGDVYLLAGWGSCRRAGSDAVSAIDTPSRAHAGAVARHGA
jgi:hypothetical protein